MNPAITEKDVDILARTCFGEARGEGLEGMVAVAWVAINRAKIAAATRRPQFGDGTIAAACLAPEQFSCWNQSDPNRSFIKLATLGSTAFQVAYLAALSAITGHISDPTDGATGYWASYIPTPAWAAGRDYVSIGRHKFVKDI